MRILLMDGDGIGPEIMAATRRSLEALDRQFGLGLSVSYTHLTLPTTEYG